jgi:hypothetical protein
MLQPILRGRGQHARSPLQLRPARGCAEELITGEPHRRRVLAQHLCATGRRDETVAWLVPEYRSVWPTMNHMEHVQGLMDPTPHLKPAGHELVKGIPVLLQPVDDGFTATLLEANIASSGETEEPAIPNLLSCGHLRGLVFRTSGRTWTGTQAPTRGPFKVLFASADADKGSCESHCEEAQSQGAPGQVSRHCRD